MRTLVYTCSSFSRRSTSGENAVVCELSESVQPRNVDSLRVGDGYACQDHDLQHTRCCDPDVAVWASVGWLLHGSGSCGVLGWSECAWRTGCEWFVFLSARNRYDVVDAEDGYFEIADCQKQDLQDSEIYRKLKNVAFGRVRRELPVLSNYRIYVLAVSLNRTYQSYGLRIGKGGTALESRLPFPYCRTKQEGNPSRIYGKSTDGFGT